MTTHAVRTAILGPGKVADTHARALLKLSTLVAVCGRDASKAQTFAERYAIHPYTDLAEMLHAERLDAVVICTPHPQHAENALVALNAGVPVLVEKPMAINLADCDRMIEAAAKNHVALGVVSQRRWYEPVQRVKAAIEAGKIGAPILGLVQVLGWRSAEYFAMDAWRGTWEGEGGGVLVNQAVHQLDLFQWFMGPIVEVYGAWANFNHPTIEVEDTAVAVLRFQNGALGNIVLSNSQKPGLYAKIHVHGTSGASVGVQTEGGSVFIAGIPMQVDPAVNDIWTVPKEEQFLDEWTRQDRARGDIVEIVSHYHYLQIRDFLQAVQEHREPSVNGVEGRKSVELFTAIYRSQAAHTPVVLPLKG